LAEALALAPAKGGHAFNGGELGQGFLIGGPTRFEPPFRAEGVRVGVLVRVTQEGPGIR
jgi:hypothetical protein